MSTMIRFVVALLLLSTFAFSQNEKKCLSLAKDHIGYEEYLLAIPYLKEAVGYNANNAEANYLLGKCLFLTQQKQEALKYLKAAYDFNSQIAPDIAWYYASCLHFNLQFDDAIAMYAIAASRLPKNDDRLSEIPQLVANCKYGKDLYSKPVDVKIENLGPGINTQYADHSPVITVDGEVLIFTAARPENLGSNAKMGFLDEDIFKVEKDANGKWKTAVNLGKPVNSTAFDASIGLSADGQQLFLYKNPPGSGDVFVSKLNGTTWSTPVPVDADINQPKFHEPSVCLSADGNTMLFVSDRNGGQGKHDLYICKKQEGKWSEPVNLGPLLNTPGEEDAPYLHPNGKELYFSSTGHPGMGGYDIFKSTLGPSGNWGAPVNLGYPINSTDDDIYFVLTADGKEGFCASSRQGTFGDVDIWKISFPQPKPVVKDTVVATVEQPKVVINPVTLLRGIVSDEKSGQPIGATVRVIDLVTNQVITELNANSVTGKYLVTLISGKNYGLYVEAPGYTFRSENFEIPSSTDYQEVEKDVKLKKIEVGTKIVLKNIFFDTGKSTLRPESVAELQEMFKIMTDNPAIVVEISGHTDNIGSDESNQSLSQSRAAAVVEYLVKLGIAPGRLVAKGYGESKPIDTNDTDSGRQNNRRTEFTIIKN